MATEKQKEASKKHYELNKEKVKQRAHLRNQVVKISNRKFLDDYLSKQSCVDCGNSNPIVLEFDHVRGVKKLNVSDMILRSYSLKTIQDEIDKCEIRCANCHRIKTYNRRNNIL